LPCSKKVEATTEGTDDAVDILEATVNKLGHTVRGIDYTDNMAHDSLNRLERTNNKMDSRLLHIEREQKGTGEVELAGDKGREIEEVQFLIQATIIKCSNSRKNYTNMISI
jgi:hypothetical protein